jgi:predicted nucleic acid-binding protein
MTVATFALDSSCMVAAVCAWHEHHGVAVASIERRLQRGDRLVVAAHALLETYAVLTRLPTPNRLAPTDAWTLVEANFVDQATLVAASGINYATLLAALAARGIGGGRAYDGLIADCASRGKVEELLTLNPRHFVPGPPGIAIVEPPG